MRLLVVVLVVGALAGCGSTPTVAPTDESAGDTTSTTATTTATTIPIESTTTVEPTTTTTVVPTTEAAAGPALSQAEYLAAMYRWNAGLVAEQNSLNQQGAAVEEYVIVWDDAAESLAAFVPPPEAADFHAAYVALADEMASAFADFAIESEENADLATSRFLDRISANGTAVTELDAQMRTMALELFSESDGAEPAYFVEVFSLQAEAAPATERIFELFGLLATEPERALEELSAVIDVMVGMNDGWASLTPPSELEELHQRQITFLGSFTESVTELVDVVRSGGEPSMTLVLDMTSSAAEAADINVAWSYAIADELEALGSS